MTHKPPFCPFIYTDGVKLFLEFDNFVLDFVFTEAGLHKALKHIPNIARQPGFLSGGQNIADRVIVKNRIAKKTPTPKVARKTTEDRNLKVLKQRISIAAVDDVVRKLIGGKIK